jgi:serine/threonine protein kinase
MAWIAYRWIDGESVQGRLERGPVPFADARSIGLDVARALAHAHGRGIVHRDVTPGNVLITRDGTARLVDFGLARTGTGEGITRSRIYVGTPGYVAPEVMHGMPADARSDLYGLGVLLYAMLTGRLPFEGAPMRALAEAPPPPSRFRPELPPRFEDTVLRLLDPLPQRRFRDAAEVAQALRALDLERSPSAWDLLRRRFGSRIIDASPRPRC